MNNTSRFLRRIALGIGLMLVGCGAEISETSPPVASALSGDSGATKYDSGSGSRDAGSSDASKDCSKATGSYYDCYSCCGGDTSTVKFSLNTQCDCNGAINAN